MSNDEKIQLAVVGFTFSRDLETVLLIRKKRPEFQAGRLNGPGGKVEPGETQLEAMIREFREETGIITGKADWEPIIDLNAPGRQVRFYRTHLEERLLLRAEARPPSDEKLLLIRVDQLSTYLTMRNIQWMIRFCLDDSPYDLPISITELKETHG